MRQNGKQAGRKRQFRRGSVGKLGKALGGAGLTLAVAESCTGGLIGHRVTSVPGSSSYFVGGTIAYSNAAKERELGVSRAMLRRAGAVSSGVARQMAVGVRARFRADIGVGVTGIAGPGGGTRGKPVGLVYVAVAGPRGCGVRRFIFKGTRAAIKELTSRAAIAMINEWYEMRFD